MERFHSSRVVQKVKLGLTVKLIRLLLIITGIIFLAVNCGTKGKTVEKKLPFWIEKYGYSQDEVLKLYSGRGFAGPLIEVKVENTVKKMLIDFSTVDLLLKEDVFTKIDFEPQRISSLVKGKVDIMFEEGYVHNVGIFNELYPIVYASLVKRSNVPFKPNGIVGLSYIMDGRITLDGPNSLSAFTKSPRRSFSDINSGEERVDINIDFSSDNRTGQVTFKGYFQDREVTVMLKTDISKSIIDPDFVSSIFEDYDESEIEIDSLVIGSAVISELECEIDRNPFLDIESIKQIDILLGVDILDQFILTVDFIEKSLILE